MKKYGICFWLLNKGKEQVIKEGNFNVFDQLQPQGRIFNIIDDKSDYYQIADGDKVFTILKDAINIIDNVSILDIGTPVKLKNKPDQEGIVMDRYWHFKDNKPFYLLSFSQKKSSKRFFEDDFL